MSVFDVDGPEKLRQLFEYHLDAGLHHGAQLCVYRGGERVLDCAGGVTGPEGEETTGRQKHLLFSCTKPFAGVCLHQLVERGALDYDDRVIDHWPEFAEPGSAKAEVTIRHVFSHQAGLHKTALDEQPDRWRDWNTVVTAMEDAELTFEPGTAAAYHTLTYGWLVGELVRRVSGQSVDAYAREYLFDPLGMEDTYIGLPGAIEDDVATLVGFEAFSRCRTPDVGLGTLTNTEAADLFNQEWLHRTVVPSSTGIGNARDLARFYACLANEGELDGARLLNVDTVVAATEVQAQTDQDPTLGMPRRYAMGFERAGSPWDKYGSLAPEGVFGHGGLGSVVGWADPGANLAMAYVTNGIRDEFEHGLRVNTMADAVRSVFG